MRDLSKEILHIVDLEQKTRGTTARELAKKIGCSEQIISDWKTGKRNISLHMAEKVLEELGYELTIVRKGE